MVTLLFMSFVSISRPFRLPLFLLLFAVTRSEHEPPFFAYEPLPTAHTPGALSEHSGFLRTDGHDAVDWSMARHYLQFRNLGRMAWLRPLYAKTFCRQYPPPSDTPEAKSIRRTAHEWSRLIHHLPFC